MFDLRSDTTDDLQAPLAVHIVEDVGCRDVIMFRYALAKRAKRDHREMDQHR